jgi:hypothetical protein
MKRELYEQTVSVTCSDSGKTIVAEVLSFTPNKKLSVSINRSIKMEMLYNDKNKIYTAKQTGLEFYSKGPKEIIVTKTMRG